jgi:putative Mg2+ transporter-C (MgtC) family protein
VFIDNWQIFLRLLVAIVLCGLIGWEREATHKPAGLRTHVLVGLGSAVFMILALLLARMAEGGFAVDASRVVAGVVTGIGFLGAGTIIRSEAGVTGLTTAASIWTVAGIGMAAGAGYFGLANLATLLTLAVLLILSRLEHRGPGPEKKRKAAAPRPRKKIAREDF